MSWGQGLVGLVCDSARGLHDVDSGERFRALEQRIEPTIDCWEMKLERVDDGEYRI